MRVLTVLIPHGPVRRECENNGKDVPVGAASRDGFSQSHSVTPVSSDRQDLWNTGVSTPSFLWRV